MSARVYIFEPNGWDLIDPTPNAPAPGTLVRKVQPFGCPRNGTMGHCYVEAVETVEERKARSLRIAKSGSCRKRRGDARPFALVSLGSLTPAGTVTS